MRYVIAVGGNALENPNSLNKLCACVLELFRHGSQIIVTHGNGPQVGALALHEKKRLALLTEETEVRIGGRLVRALHAAMKYKKEARISVVLTRVLVDANDPEFERPSKPIGRFYTKGEAALAERKRGIVMKHLLNGYRRVVPSPKPKKILELSRINRLLAEGNMVIAAGGGGIAVARRKGRLVSEDAVIDKDLASSLLATKVKADALFILTNVDGVFVNFKTRRAHMLKLTSPRELRSYANAGYFESGSMLPKVEACIGFVRKTGKTAVIGNLARPADVLGFKNSTVVRPSRG